MKKLLLVFMAVFSAALFTISTNTTQASGSAKLYIQRISGNLLVGQNIELELREDSGSVDVNAVQADIIYDATKLEYIGVNDSGTAFSIVAETNGDNPGVLKVGRGVSGGANVTGDQLITTVTFTVLSSSSRSEIAFRNTSQILNPNGGSPFNEWDGFSNPYTISLFEQFNIPRFMQLKVSAKKVDPTNGTSPFQTIPEGTQIEFDNKLSVNGKGCYRTNHDTSVGARRCMMAYNLIEIPHIPFVSPRWMMISSTTEKINPATGALSGEELTINSQHKFNYKMYLKDKLYFRTEADTKLDKKKWVLSSKVDEIPYTVMTKPRYLNLSQDTKKVIPNHDKFTGSTLRKDRKIFFNEKITINNILYLRTSWDTSRGFNRGIEFSKLY